MSRKSSTAAKINPLTLIPADPYVVFQAKDLKTKVLLDMEFDTESTATEAALSYLKLIHFLLPAERSEIERTWSALNLEPNETRIENFVYYCDKVIDRASQDTSW